MPHTLAASAGTPTGGPHCCIMTEPDQFDLFAEGTPPSPAKPRRARRDGVAAARVDAEVTTLAAQLPPGVRLGTSSWAFPGWAGLVYDGDYAEAKLAREGLAAYAAHPLLRSVGIDRTFYAPIDEAAFRRYASQVHAVAPGFRFLVKAPMRVTGPRLRSEDGRWSDNPAFLDATLAAREFVLPALAGLGEHCGPLTFQFPPLGARLTRSPLAFADRLAEFLLALPRLSGAAFYAVEVRDPELLGDDYLAALNAGGATHALAIHARMPSAQAQGRYWRESGALPLTVRWSLHSGFDYEAAKERYAPFSALVDEDPEGRAQVAALVREAVALGRDAYVIANNKAEGSAPLTLGKLAAGIVAG